MIHEILTVILAGQLKKGGNSIASEVLVVILFGGALGWFSIIGNGLVSRLVGAYLGEYRTGKLLHYQSGALIFQSDSYSGHQPADTGERDVDVL